MRGKKIDTEVCQVDTDDGTHDRMDPEICQVDKQTINLPRMVGAGGR